MIDKVIRFVWIDRNSSHTEAEIPFEYQVCIMSAAVMNPDYHIVVHTNYPLKYDKLMVDGKTMIHNELIPDELIAEAHSLGIQKVVAHVSDYVRYSILKERGGFYLDTDVFCLKSFDDLLDKRCVLAREKPTTVCCAAYGFEKEHPIIDIILDEYHANYVENEWLYNSQFMLKKAAKEFGEEDVTILDYETGFFYPNWKKFPMCLFYDEFTINSKSDIPNKFKGYTQHMWSSTPCGDILRDYIRTHLESRENTYIIQLFNFYIDSYKEMLRNG